MDQEAFRKLILGRTIGLPAAIMRFFLEAVSEIYAAIISLRNFLYDKGWLKTHYVDAAVISIGNITVGGTGKTPLVIWLCNLLQQKNINCAILTRGYKTKRGNLSDEPAILAKNCPQAQVVINPNRVAGAEQAIKKYGAEVLIMDDGFQHRRLGRNLDIVTIDGTAPPESLKILPAGLLREPVAALLRADAVVISRCGLVSQVKLAQLEEELLSVNPHLLIARATHNPVCVKTFAQKEIGLDELINKKIFAFCGIGNPDAFLGTVKTIGVNLVGSKIYNDHHQYTAEDINDIYEEARYLDADLILSTQKDWTNTALAASTKEDIPFAYLMIELKFIDGEDKLKQLIEDRLAGKILRR